MALQDQTISVNFGQGIDTKTDPKMVVEGKFTYLENAVFKTLKRATKRNGYISLPLNIVGGGSLSSPKGIQSYNNELVAFDSGKLYSYSPSLSGWVNKGVYESIAVTETEISNSQTRGISPGGLSGHLMQSCAVLGNYALIVYSLFDKSQVGFVTYATVLDLSNNLALVKDVAVTGAVPATVMSCGKACVLGSASLAITYLDSSNHISLITLTVSGSGVVFNAPVTVATDPVGYTIASGTSIIQYDVITTATGAALAYSSAATFGGTPTDVVLLTLDTSGSVTHTARQSAVGPALPISVCQDPTSLDLWVYWVDNTTPSAGHLYYAVFSSTLASVLSKTTVTTNLNTVNQLAPVVVNSTTQTILYSYGLIPVSGAVLYSVQSLTCTQSGAVTAGSYSCFGVDIHSKPFSVNGNTYIPLSFYSTDPANPQGAVYFVSLSSGAVVGKALYGQAVRSLLPGYLYSAIPISSTRVASAMGFVIENDTTGAFLSQLVGTTLVSLDFNHPDAYQGIVVNGSLVLNGGVVSTYDGRSVCELGFHMAPEIITVDVFTSGGSLADGNYSYYATYEWSDANGKVYQSAPSRPGTVTLTGGGGSGSINVTVRTLKLTQKFFPAYPQIVIYRTEASGTVPHRMTYQGQVVEGPSPAATLTFFDSIASAASSELLYISGGVIENIAPPPSLAMTVHNNRLWMIDSEKGAVWYSKSLSAGSGIETSDLLQISVDTRGGNAVALAEMDDKLIIFKNTLPFFVYGDGANDLGSGSTLSVPEPIPSDVGAAGSRGVITLPDGVHFKSNSGGFYRLNRALGIEYHGTDVEGFNSQTITAATQVPGTTHVRFLTSSGLTLLFDYLVGQWSVFTNHQGYGATIWQGVYVYARTDGSLYQESPSSFLDGATPYSVRAKLSPLKLAGVQGFQRVRRVGLLGDFVNGASGSHGVQISAAYDYSTTFSTPIPYVFGAASAAATFQYRERLPIQKCEALQLYIEEITTGASGEYIDLSDLALEVGVKRGMNKLPAGQSVG